MKIETSVTIKDGQHHCWGDNPEFGFRNVVIGTAHEMTAFVAASTDTMMKALERLIPILTGLEKEDDSFETTTSKEEGDDDDSFPLKHMTMPDGKQVSL
jgi:hypothetical protein